MKTTKLNLVTLLTLLLCLQINFLQANDKATMYKFIENKGQYNESVFFCSNIPSGKIYYHSNKFTYQLTDLNDLSEYYHRISDQQSTNGLSVSEHAIELQFTGALTPEIKPYNQASTKLNYFKGNNPEKWVSNAGVYSKLHYTNLYSGIDMITEEYEGSLKYDFIVQPYANPSDIKLTINGADHLKINDKGELVIQTSIYNILEQKPFVYQLINGKKREIDSKFHLVDNVLTFNLGSYDNSKELIIDPNLVFCTYSNTDNANAVVSADAATYDLNNNLLVAAGAFTTGFPPTTGAYETNPNTNGDVMMSISKTDPATGNLIFATYIYGSNKGWGFGQIQNYPLSMSVDANDDIYIFGHTNTDDFPVTAGVYQPNLSSDIDYVICKLSGDGANLLASTYLGGGSTESGTLSEFPGAIMVNGGDVYVVGTTNSTDFPTTGGVVQGALNSNRDAIVSKLNANLTALTWSTYLGGSGNEVLSDIKLFDDGNILVCGNSNSTDFPGMNGLNPNNLGNQDGIVIKLDPNASSILNGTYLGTNDKDKAKFVQIDRFSDVYVYGAANGAYPVSTGAYSSNGALYYYVHKLDPTLSTTEFSTRVGGTAGNTNELYPTAFGIDECTHIYFSGSVSQGGFPTTADAYETNPKGVYMCKLDIDGSNLVYGSYFGGVVAGSHFHESSNCKYNDKGRLFHTECTTANDYPITANGNPSTTNSDPTDTNNGTNIGSNDAASFVFDFYFFEELPKPDLGPDITMCDPSAQLNAGINNPELSFIWQDGSTDSLYSVVDSGLYYVQVYHMCDTVHDTIRVIIDNPLEIGFTTNPSTCGQNDGSATVNPSTGGTAPYTYNWSTNTGGQTNATANNLGAGTYSVTVTDANNCVRDTSLTIANQDGVEVSIVSSTNPLCNSGSDGEIIIIAAGGSEPYSFNWSNGNTTQNNQNIGAGNYCITVTDNIGCFSVTCTDLESPPALSLTLDTTVINCIAGGNGILTNVSGGTSGYSYEWFDSGNNSIGTGPSIDGLVTGSYSVIVNDANNCSITDAIDVQNALTVEISNITSTPAECGVPNGTASVTATAGTEPYNYQWDANTQNQTSTSATALAVGNYAVTVTDANNCSANATVAVGNIDGVVVSVTNTQNTLCYGSSDGSITIQASQGETPYSYSWSNGSNTTTANNIPAGQHCVTVTDNTGCYTTLCASITQPSPITITFDTTVINCITDGNGIISSVTGGTPGYSYNWEDSNNNSIGSQPTVANLITGTYYLIVTDSNGCTAQNNQYVENMLGVTITDISSTQAQCGESNGTTSVTAFGGATPYNYLWSDAANQSTSTATGLSVGNYTVTVTDQNGCTDQNSVYVATPSAVTVTLNSTNVSCYGYSDGSVSVSINGTATPCTYLWSDPNNSTTAAVNNLAPNVYNVTVTDATGCTVFDSIRVGEPLLITATTASTQSSCGQDDGLAEITNVGNGLSPYSYNWSNGTTAMQNSNIYAGAYDVTITDNNGCYIIETVVVNDENGPVATASTLQHVNCYGASEGIVSVTVTGGLPNYMYQWNSGHVSSTASSLRAGNYTVTVTDADGCVTTASTTITQPTELVLDPSQSDPTCYGYDDGYIAVQASGGTSPYTYNWSVQAFNVSTVTGLEEGDYGVTVSDENSCSDTANYHLNEPAALASTVTGNDISCFNLCDGDASVSAANGVTPYTYIWSDSQSNATATGLCSGNHNVTITDNNNCFITDNINLSEPSELIIVLDNYGDVSCYGGNDGFVQITASGGTPNYTYQWTNNVANSNLATGIPANNWGVTVTDVNGCQNTLFQEVSQPQLLQSSIIDYNNVSCNAACDGYATVQATGGTQPYTYQWDVNASLQNTPTAANLCGDMNYQVTITDENNCTTTSSQFITQPSALTVTNTVNDAHCGQSDGDMQVSVVGGTMPYSYIWNQPINSTGSTVTGVPAGCYTVNIIDNNNCSQTELVCLNDITGPTATLSNAQEPSCFAASDGYVVANVSGGGTPYSYQWYDINNNNLNSNTPALLLIPGNMQYYLIVEDAFGCIGTFQHFLDQPSEVFSAITKKNHVSCYGGNDGSATVFAAGGTPNYTYTWYSSGQTTAVATGLQAGTYSVIVKDQNACPDTAVVVINEPQKVTLSYSVTDVSCFDGNNGKIIIDANGGTGYYNYQWNPNVANTSIGNNLEAGTYNITVYDQYGCNDSITPVVNQPDVLAANIVASASTCTQENGSVTVTNISGGTPQYYFQWDKTNVVTQTATGLYHGTHQVSVTDENACLLVLDVYVPDLPGPVINKVKLTDPLCYGDYNGSATVTATGGSSPLAYQWNDLIQQNTPVAHNLGAGNYCVTVSDINGCKVSTCRNIIEPDSFSVIAVVGNEQLCPGQCTNLWAVPSGGTTPYNDSATVWTSSSAFSANTLGVHRVCPEPNSINDYAVTAQDDNGCIASSSVQIIVSPILQVTIPDTVETCIGNYVALCASGEGGTAVENYQWKWSNGDQSIGDNPSCTQIRPTATSPYRVILEDGCTPGDTAEVVVVVHPLPSINFGVLENEGCPPLTAYFNSATNPADAEIYWDFDADGNIDEELNHNPIFTFENSGLFTVEAIAVTDKGCRDTLAQEDYIHVYPSPVANFTYSPEDLDLTNPLVNTDASSSFGVDSTYNWFFNDKKANNMQKGITASHIYSDTGKYEIKLTVVNQYGCKDTAIKPVFIGPSFALYAPNAFTPNGNGKNDGFKLEGVGIAELKLYIFDRWGEQIAEQNGLDDPWTGSVKGSDKIAPEGVYIWKAIYTPVGYNRPEQMVGHVTVVR